MQEDNLLINTPDTTAVSVPAETDKKSGVPDKFWDKDKQQIRVESLLKSYLELEKKLSALQTQAATVPVSPSDYNVKLDHELFTMDNEINTRLHQAGFTPTQVQLVYDLAAEKMVPLIIELSRDFEADREIEKLVKTFGGMEKWRAVSKQLLAYGQRHLPADVVGGLSGSYEGVMALYRMMQANTSPNLQDTAKVETSVDEQGLKKMMQDPKYWRDKDADMVQKVTAGFKQIFNN